MSTLQTPAEKITSDSALDAASLAGHVHNAIHIANGMVERLTTAATADLNEWLASRGARIESDLTEHSVTGHYLNGIAESLDRRLGTTTPRVDIGSFVDKMTASWRQVIPTETGFMLVDIPKPEPIVEPVNEAPVQTPQAKLESKQAELESLQFMQSMQAQQSEQALQLLQAEIEAILAELAK